MKICVIGAFGFDMLDKTTGGQPVKTRQLYHTLVDRYGKDCVTYIETYGWRSHPIRMLRNVLRESKKCDAVIMLPAHHGVQIFARLLNYCKKRTGVKIYYDVIGGWLPEKTKKDARLAKLLKRFDGIWVETRKMKNDLASQGFKNITVVPNFRKMKILRADELIYPQGYPLKACTFSRVMKEKGIETAVDAVNRLNKDLGYTAFSLDIYGPIENADKEWFETVKAKFNEQISYKGVVDPSESYTVLQKYFCLLFPTHFYTEGVPGTIVDAYAAGLPVISAKWSNFSDVVDEGITGLGYAFDNIEAFYSLLTKVAKSPKIMLDMKCNCLIKAQEFHSDNAVNIISENLCGV